jgi:hypothetical protein
MKPALTLTEKIISSLALFNAAPPHLQQYAWWDSPLLALAPLTLVFIALP